MAKGPDRLIRLAKQYADVYRKIFVARHGQDLIDFFELPIKIVLSPFTLAYDIAGSAPRGFGIPEFISHLSFSAIFAVATIGTYDIALELGKKVLCQRNCQTCNGWQALRCTMCKGTGKVQYQVNNCKLKSGEKPTAECIAEAIADNRAELVCLPSAIELPLPLPTKECPTCTGSDCKALGPFGKRMIQCDQVVAYSNFFHFCLGSCIVTGNVHCGVMSCPECKHKLQVRISADNIMEPPWKAYNVMRKMEYPYEHIVQSMRDPKIAAFWLITMPQMLGGFNYDDDVRQKIWWAYKESMRYDQLRDLVAKRQPGWEHLQEALISIDPMRARDDPMIVRNVPYYKAKKALEAEVMKLEVPTRPQNWGELNLPLNETTWTKEELKDPKKLYEMTVLLNAQREMADKILDSQWEIKWRQEKLNKLLEEKVKPYIQTIDNGVLPRPIIIHQDEGQKKSTKRRRWLFF